MRLKAAGVSGHGQCQNLLAPTHIDITYGFNPPKHVLQILKFPPVLHPKALISATGQVELSCLGFEK